VGVLGRTGCGLDPAGVPRGVGGSLMGGEVLNFIRSSIQIEYDLANENFYTQVLLLLLSTNRVIIFVASSSGSYSN